MSSQTKQRLLSSHPLTRRQFIGSSATATALLCTGGLLQSSYAAESTLRQNCISLDGAWQVTKAGETDWIPATVPGCIHTDLLTAKQIPDPFYRDQEKTVQWVGETDWLYARSFNLDEKSLAHRQVRLRCEGLDTLATISINGQEVGQTDNMFRTWEFDIKHLLKPGSNRIEILLKSAVPFVNKLEDKRKENKGVTGRAWLRKQPCHFGWDWAPTLITSGIWRSISLECCDEARIEDVLILQDHTEQNSVGLTAQIAASTALDRQLQVIVAITHEHREIAKTRKMLTNGSASCRVSIKDPKLWWPAGMGRQPLYTIRVDLLDDKETLLDSQTKRIGLRTLRLLDQDEEHPLRFEVNGVEFFAKGANWIPADAFSNRVTPGRLHRYIEDAVAANMNMLRFWGGGYYEEDALYDACDELGICVWADFKFACASYPAFDPGFVENVRQEARDNLKRLRHHPCIAVWCGNNEIAYLVKDEWSEFSMAREGYDHLFKEVLGGEVKALSPQTSYVSGSPDCGDVHYWEVWWGARTFEAYRELSGFMSEFGYQSYPEPRTVYAYTNATDRASTMTDVMKWHQRCPLGNTRIQNMTGNYFRPGRDFDSTVWISQLVQAYGIKLGAEYWRQQMPKSMGCLFWQYNDCWPVASWASVDYYGRWKALHYATRHFYAPLLISGFENVQNKFIKVFVSSDNAEACRGTAEWVVTDLQGSVLERAWINLTIQARASQKVTTLRLENLCEQHGTNNVLTWLKLTVDGQVVSRNLVTFARPKEIDLQDPELITTIKKSDAVFEVTLSARKPALWAWLNLGEFNASYSDNFVHLNGLDSLKICVTLDEDMSLDDFKKHLQVRSLFDTYAQIS